MSNKQKITVLQLISSVSFLGAERVVSELAAYLDSSRYRVQIGLLGSPIEVVEAFKNALDGTAAEVIVFPCGGKISLYSVLFIKKHLVSNDIKIVHSHGYKSDTYAMLASVSNNNIVTIATNHNWITSSLKEQIYKALDSLVLRTFKMVVAVSNVLMDEIIGKGIKSEKVKVIANGIDVKKDEIRVNGNVRTLFGLSDKHFIIGCVASLTNEKAHSDLISAFAIVVKSVPAARLVIVGSGFLYDDLCNLAVSLGITESVVFTGYRDDARSLYSAFDVFALVSHSEGLPMAMLEAMSASLPVVVSSVGGIPQVIKSMENGILITPGDIGLIANSFIKLAREPALRESLGRNARNEVVNNYSVSRMARDYEQVYEKVMENNV